ncbi:hypothetical protein WA026_016215 [Henosepilachna vigintioctopunctata]|uniref:Reverse transcriptase domain-containing protein n=1 Tax=Henosepilachna vigintioctopunctata TaxID=420089 RepID=A0AAW1TWT9_9CUCU
MTRILYANINSFDNKKELTRHYIKNNNINCAMFVETKTKTTSNTNYEDWRCICKHGTIQNRNIRGGALVMAEKTIEIGKGNPPHLNNPWNDVLHFTIPYQDDKIHFFLVYIHHSSQLIEENLLIKASQYKYCIILGDFNTNTRKRTQIEKFLRNSDFIKITTPPTFLMQNNPDSTPDLILCTKNIKRNIHNINLNPDLGSDHLAIEFSLNTNIKPTEYSQENKFIFDKCNIKEVNKQMLEMINPETEINSQYISDFNDTLSRIITAQTPVLKKKYYSQTLPPYILKLIRVKKQLYREYRINNDLNLKRKFNELNKDIHKLISSYRSHTYLEACKEIENHRGRTYWKAIKRLSKYTKHNSTEPIQINGKTLTGDKDISNAFAEHFQKILQQPVDGDFDEDHKNMIEQWYQNDFPLIQPETNYENITEDEYYKVLHQGKSTTPGYDNISRKILRKLDPGIHSIIIKIYNFCLNNCYFPDDWRRGIVIAIPKAKTDQSNIENYRPITLLPVLGKNFEKILCERMRGTMGDSIPAYQFGFKTKTSTIHPLVILTSNIQCNRKMRKKTAALFMDIKKAFDTVWHAGLVYKFFHINVPIYMLKLIDQFLSDRRVQVKVKNDISKEFTPAQGLPQGSPLSPLLYNLFCSDIYSHVYEKHNHINKQAYMLQFADDTALVSHDKTTNKCIEQLQELTDNTVEWMKLWRMQPNPTKSELIIFNHKLRNDSPRIKLIDNWIKPSQKCKYLGVQIDNKLQFKNHIKTQKS